MTIMRNGKRELQDEGQVKMVLVVIMVFSMTGLLSACNTPKLPPPSEKYVYNEDKGPKASANSLWADRAGLYENVQARRVNDLVTINVLENIAGSGAADTALSKTSAFSAAVTSMFGAPLSLGLPNLYGSGTGGFAPVAAGNVTDSFKGDGSTTRSGTLVGTITAKVVEVMPNGNLVLESRKELTINHEKQILILRGMARPDDIALNNTISSGQIADAKVYFVGDGVMQSKQRGGWLVRILDEVWPF